MTPWPFWNSIVEQQAPVIFLALALHSFLRAFSRQLGLIGLFLSLMPATILHELAHYVTALIFGGRPCGFTFIPRRTESAPWEGEDVVRWNLGQVTIRNPNFFARTPAALAPLFWIPLGLLLGHNWASFFGDTFIATGLKIVALSFVFPAAVPSWQDLKVSVFPPFSLFFWGAFIFALHMVFS